VTPEHVLPRPMQAVLQKSVQSRHAPPLQYAVPWLGVALELFSQFMTMLAQSLSDVQESPALPHFFAGTDGVDEDGVCEDDELSPPLLSDVEPLPDPSAGAGDPDDGDCELSF
jgi:hypothetical protein